jgi:hypothetical protein
MHKPTIVAGLLYMVLEMKAGIAKGLSPLEEVRNA